jgi:hypothetical protein
MTADLRATSSRRMEAATLLMDTEQWILLTSLLLKYFLVSFQSEGNPITSTPERR